MFISRSMRMGVVGLVLVVSAWVLADPKVEEAVLGPVVQDAKYVICPVGVHLAVVARKGSRMMVTVDGTAGPKVDDVITPVTAWIDPRPWQAMSTSDQQKPENQPQPVTFSREGNHFAYVARIGQDWILFEDHKEILRLPVAGVVGATAGIAGNAGNTDIRLQFTGEGGKHLFFAKSGFAGYELWVDGQKMSGYYGSGGGGTEGTIDPLITRDGEHFAYVAAMGTHPGDRRALMRDGKEQGYLIDNLQYTPDGKHLLGIGRAKDGEHLVVDGKSLFTARGINAVHLAPTGIRIIAVLSHANKDGSIGQFLLVDGKPVEATLCQTVKKVIFSPDGKHYAAVCARPGAEFVVTDGKKGQEYQSINDYLTGLSCGMSFSPDSSKLAYVANANGKAFLVINDDESDAYENSAYYYFSADGKHLATYGMQGQNFLFTLDGKAVQLPRTGMAFDSLTFSPDSTRYAFFTGGNLRDGGPVWVDGKETGIGGIFSFSPDSKHVAIVGYKATTNQKGLFIDGNLAFPMEQSIAYHAFSPDSQHLYWMSLEHLATPTATDAFEWVTYADGKPVAHHDRGAAAQKLLFPNGFGQFAKTPPAWSVGADGALAMVNPTPDGIKRTKVTPGPDTGLGTILQAAQAAEAQAKLEADPKYQKEKRDREVAEMRRKADEARTARYEQLKKQQEEQKKQAGH